MNGNTISVEELWSSVFGSGFDSFSPWWLRVVFSDGTDWDKVDGDSSVTLYYADPDKYPSEGVKSAVLSVGDVVASYQECAYTGRVDRDYEQWDCIDADVVLQYAIFGEVIYG